MASIHNAVAWFKAHPEIRALLVSDWTDVLLKDIHTYLEFRCAKEGCPNTNFKTRLYFEFNSRLPLCNSCYLEEFKNHH